MARPWSVVAASFTKDCYRLGINRRQNVLEICGRKTISIFRRNKEEPDQKIELKVDAPEYKETVPLPYAKNYRPPPDAEQVIMRIVRSSCNLADSKDIQHSTPLGNNMVKCQVLSRCVEHFQYNIPNILLNEMRTIGDVLSYFKTESTSKLPVAQFGNVPKNMHLQLDPVRFTEDTKAAFSGKTAFPNRDTIVSSLKYRDVLKGFKNPPSYKKKKGFSYA